MKLAFLLAVVPLLPLNAQTRVRLPPNDHPGIKLILSDGHAIGCVANNPASGLEMGQDVLFRFETDTQPTRTIITPGVLPYIRIEADLLTAEHTFGQTFLVNHECGHINSYPDMSEVTANCWASRQLNTLDYFTWQEWLGVFDMLTTKYPEAKGAYPSGNEQVRQMRLPACLTPFCPDVSGTWKTPDMTPMQISQRRCGFSGVFNTTTKPPISYTLGGLVNGKVVITRELPRCTAKMYGSVSFSDSQLVLNITSSEGGCGVAKDITETRIFTKE